MVLAIFQMIYLGEEILSMPVQTTGFTHKLDCSTPRAMIQDRQFHRQDDNWTSGEKQNHKYLQVILLK
jgi:hypothetical protein